MPRGDSSAPAIASSASVMSKVRLGIATQNRRSSRTATMEKSAKSSRVCKRKVASISGCVPSPKACCPSASRVSVSVACVRSVAPLTAVLYAVSSLGPVILIMLLRPRYHRDNHADNVGCSQAQEAAGRPGASHSAACDNSVPNPSHVMQVRRLVMKSRSSGTPVPYRHRYQTPRVWPQVLTLRG
jgi:hypothetical protein